MTKHDDGEETKLFKMVFNKINHTNENYKISQHKTNIAGA